MLWTDEQTRQLQQLWSLGESPMQIAATIGNGLSQNAVRIKIKRLKLDRNAPVPVAETVALPVSTRVSFMDLKDSMCRWPIGEPKTGTMLYCGGSKHSLRSAYCKQHARESAGGHKLERPKEILKISVMQLRS